MVFLSFLFSHVEVCCFLGTDEVKRESQASQEKSVPTAVTSQVGENIVVYVCV